MEYNVLVDSSMKEYNSSMSNGNNFNIVRRFQDPKALVITGGHMKITDRNHTQLFQNHSLLLKEAQETSRNVYIEIQNQQPTNSDHPLNIEFLASTL